MYRVMRGSLFIFLFGFIVSCNRNPYAATNRQYKKQVKAFAKTIRKTPPPDSVTTAIPWVGTINFNLRKPNFVVIHHTAQNSCEQTLKTFTVTQSQVSAHYVICKDGTIHHMLNDYLRAWHGGVGKWGNVTDVNSSSIGIELDNNGSEPFTEPQINSLLRLLDQLKRAYAIPVANFIGHSDIAPTRKVDPNVYFPWKQLADSGFGCWWSDTTNVTVPPQFDHLQALRIVGYDIKDSSTAIAAFKRKYLQQDNSHQLTEADKKVLFTLYRRYE
ncbi:MAG: N-acetylmuramoyl-L-alanine amidase [Flavisolibacter sp.]|nr:N-acetylmuramoyl-L-alanine amidase [Flavisolibacter sp.]